MNERMLELARQAGLKKPHASDSEYLIDFDWRLFGDLIVLECAKSMWSAYSEDHKPDAGIIRLCRDFGVDTKDMLKHLEG